MEDKKQYFFDKRKNVKLILYALYSGCGVLVLLDFIVHRHINLEWERLLGFYSIYGFISCTAIVLGSKVLRTLVSRDEDYYEREETIDRLGGSHVDQ